MRKELEDIYAQDARYGPFLTLLDAVASPDIDYYSPEVQDIIDKLHAMNDEPLQHSDFKVVPFIPKLEADVKGFGTRVDGFAEKIEKKVKDVFGFSTKTFAELGDPAVQQVVDADDFHNWGKVVSFRASYTLVVRSIEGVCKVVKWAASQGKKVRVGGFRHSWRYVRQPIRQWFLLIEELVSATSLERTEMF